VGDLDLQLTGVGRLQLGMIFFAGFHNSNLMIPVPNV
jgi:hypothetical protein